MTLPPEMPEIMPQTSAGHVRWNPKREHAPLHWLGILFAMLVAFGTATITSVIYNEIGPAAPKIVYVPVPSDCGRPVICAGGAYIVHDPTAIWEARLSLRDRNHK